jgi:subtilisin family serine protease
MRLKDARLLAALCVLGVALLATGQLACAQLASAPAAATPQVHARIVVTFVNSLESSPRPAGTTGPRYGGATYLVGQSAHAMARRVASQYSLKEVASWPIKLLSVHCVVYEIPDQRTVSDVLEQLSKDRDISLAQPLQEFHTLSSPEHGEVPPYNDPLYDLQTNLTALGIERAHTRTRGAGVHVGLIDTGVDARHPDLQGRIVSTRSFVPTQAPSARSYRHGTAMAGLIAAVADNHIGIVGIAPLAQLEVFEACWQLRPDADDAACSTFSLAKAIAAAIDAKVPLVNLSISGPEDPLLTQLVRVGIGNGVTFVAAAAQPADGFPSHIPGLLIAGSTEHGSWPATLTAPADHVFTLRPYGEYDFESGTSVAAAEVTGAVALVMSASHHRLSTQKIGSLLTQTPQRAAAAVATSDVPALNINGAISELDLEQDRTAASSGH